MKDRKPRYAGRVRLTPVPNQDNVFDMTRADEPIDKGTPINKNSLLKDSTAAAMGLDENATPNDALGRLLEIYEEVQSEPFEDLLWQNDGFDGYARYYSVAIQQNYQAVRVLIKNAGGKIVEDSILHPNDTSSLIYAGNANSSNIDWDASFSNNLVTFSCVTTSDISLPVTPYRVYGIKGKTRITEEMQVALKELLALQESYIGEEEME